MNPIIEGLIKIANDEDNGHARANMFKYIAKVYAVEGILESFKHTDSRDHGYMAIGKVFSTRDEELEKALSRVLSMADKMLQENRQHP